MNSNEVNEKQKKVAILVPARFGSTRFPGKALYPLNGVPMALHVCKRCELSGFDTFLLSDDKRICALYGRSLLTSPKCENGTERCAQAACQLSEYDAFISVQGDMPDITREVMKMSRQLYKRTNLSLYTTMGAADRCNPSTVKLIHNGERAIWCCRAALTYGDHHLGVYGYSRELLMSYNALTHCEAEKSEGLEQLRWLYSNHYMHVLSVKFQRVRNQHPEDADGWHAHNPRLESGDIEVTLVQNKIVPSVALRTKK